MKENIQDTLVEIIKSSLSGLGLAQTDSPSVQLDLPADERFGDFSANIALRLSKGLGKPPIEIANSIIGAIKEELKKSALADYISEVKAEGAGFINFYLRKEYFYEQLNLIAKGGIEALIPQVCRDRRVLIEFVSANPTGPLSVAHARQAAVGDSLANILSCLGFSVEREYYLNDEGNQINILGKSVGLRLKELKGEKEEFPENYYQGDYIYDIANKAKKDKCASGDLGYYAAGYILEIIKKELADFGITFNSWYSQKALRESGKIDRALALFREKGFLYEEGGALWFKSTQFGDDKDRVVIKSDASFTYLAPDIAYHQDKYARGFNRLINLWGPDHHGYINRLKAAVAALGHSPESLSIVIVQLASIFRNGKPQEMSTRKGQYITLREVLDEVGRDAARFFFLMRRTQSHLDFDLEAAKKQTPENPVYYVQYAHARICSILRSAEKWNPLGLKAGVPSPEQKAEGIKIGPGIDLSVLKEKEEMRLLKKLLQFPYILHICLSTQDPYMLTVYLAELSEAFHKFYDRHRVLNQADNLTQARLLLIEAVKAALAKGLELLGVSRPQMM